MANVDVSQLLEIVLDNDGSNNSVKVENADYHARPYKSRPRNEGNWKRNKAKFLKNSGQSYVSAHSGKIVPGKEYIQVNKCCVRDCYKLFAPATQISLFNKFYETGSYNQQNEYLISQIKVIPIAQSSSAVKCYTRHYYLADENGSQLKVCKIFFQSILHVSGGRLDRVLRKKVNFVPPIDNRGRRIRQTSSTAKERNFEGASESYSDCNISANSNIDQGDDLSVIKLDGKEEEKSRKDIVITVKTNDFNANLVTDDGLFLQNEEVKLPKRVYNVTKCTTRQRNEGNWKKNKRKFLRNSGQSYVSARGKLVPGKVFTHIDKCCVNNCHKLFSTPSQELLFTKFYENGNYNQQNEYIFSQIEITHINGLKSTKTVTNKYYLPDENGVDKKVCKSFFKNILRVSDGRLARLLRKKISLAPPIDNRGRRARQLKTDEVNEETFLENELQNGKNDREDYSLKPANYYSNWTGNSIIGSSKLYKMEFSVNANEIFNEEDGDAPKCRKRIRNESNWARNQRKTLRNSGKSYVNVCGKVVPEKKFSPINSCCINNCYQQFPLATQRMLFNKFYENGNYNQQSQYLVSQVKIIPTSRSPSSIRLYTRHYYLADENGFNRKVCKVFFQNILHVSGGRLDRALRKKIYSIPIIDNRGRHANFANAKTGTQSTVERENNSDAMEIIAFSEVKSTLHREIECDANSNIGHGELSNLVILTDGETVSFQKCGENVSNCYVSLKSESEDLSDSTEFLDAEIEDRYFEDSLRINNFGGNVELNENQSLLRRLLLLPNEIIKLRNQPRIEANCLRYKSKRLKNSGQSYVSSRPVPGEAFTQISNCCGPRRLKSTKSSNKCSKEERSIAL